ncbi:major facilitator superfamily domain-containing protein [Gautieria morchelliformis]|nr:major facilitator superfamily domain-containing protein [Gautieria morchelliformis]
MTPTTPEPSSSSTPAVPPALGPSSSENLSGPVTPDHTSSSPLAVPPPLASRPSSSKTSNTAAVTIHPSSADTIAPSPPASAVSPNNTIGRTSISPLIAKERKLEEKHFAAELDKREKHRSAVADAAWDAEPANPRNWSLSRKWKCVAIVSFYTFIPPLASSMMAPGLPAVAKRYNITNPTLIALTLSVYLLAFVIGPFFAGPLSEMYGRSRVLHLSNLLLMAFCLACVFAPTTNSLIAFRFLAGLGGCTPLAIGGGTVSDLFNERERGTAMSIYSMGPLLGPAIGPVAGGYVVQTIGIRWVFVILASLPLVAALIGIPFLEETYAPVIKQRLSIRRKADVELGEKAVQFQVPIKPAFGRSLRDNLSRPLMLLTRSLICFMLSLFVAIVYGYLYLMFTTFPTLFTGIYGWGPGISGLAYLGPGVGLFGATSLGAPLLTEIYVTLCGRNGGQGKPEFRIPGMFLGSALVPIGLLWYGWSAHARLHWIMPIVGSAIFAAGLNFVYIPVQLYLVDAFTYAASALAVASAMRSLCGFVFPLFGEQMFAALGIGGGNTLLAGVAIVTGIPFPVWLYYRGEEMRLRNPLNR